MGVDGKTGTRLVDGSGVGAAAGQASAALQGDSWSGKLKSPS